MQQIRQGDVLLVRLEQTPEAFLKESERRVDQVQREHGRLVLAEGEATGHAHVVTGEGLTLLCLPDDIESMFLHVRVYGRVGHEEHAPIPLPLSPWRGIARTRQRVRV